MKHYIYSYVNPVTPITIFNKFITLLKVNIKTPWTYPKTIFYSIRYNSGEKFILNDKSLYPYYYDIDAEDSQKNDPIRLSTRLLSNTTEYKYTNFVLQTNPENNKLTQCEEIKNNMSYVYNNLYKSFEYNMNNKDFDIPVAVSARVIYACVIFRNDDHNVLSFILKNFLSKLEYADADSISQVLYALSVNQYFKSDVWNTLIEALNTKHFEPEHTSVSFSLPHVDRYLENGKEREKLVKNDFVNKLFFDGYLAAFEAYYALTLADEKGKDINTAGIIKSLEKRIPFLKIKFNEYKSYL